jgi:hypothetical protein
MEPVSEIPVVRLGDFPEDDFLRVGSVRPTDRLHV